jgi:hypothetical protein
MACFIYQQAPGMFVSPLSERLFSAAIDGRPSEKDTNQWNWDIQAKCEAISHPIAIVLTTGGFISGAFGPLIWDLGKPDASDSGMPSIIFSSKDPCNVIVGGLNGQIRSDQSPTVFSVRSAGLAMPECHKDQNIRILLRYSRDSQRHHRAPGNFEAATLRIQNRLDGQL